MDSKRRLKRFNVNSTIIITVPTVALVVFAVLSKSLEWSSSANAVAFAVCSVALIVGFVVVTRRADRLLHELPVRANGMPYDPASPTASVRDIQRYERAKRVIRSRRGLLIRAIPVAFVGVIAIASAMLSTPVVSTLLVFTTGFAILSIERSMSSVKSCMEQRFDEAQYQPRWWMASGIALTLLQWIIMVAFGVITLGEFATSPQDGLICLLGGISGWNAARFYNTLLARSVEVDDPGTINLR